MASNVDYILCTFDENFLRFGHSLQSQNAVSVETSCLIFKGGDQNYRNFGASKTFMF